MLLCSCECNHTQLHAITGSIACDVHFIFSDKPVFFCFSRRSASFLKIWEVKWRKRLPGLVKNLSLGSSDLFLHGLKHLPVAGEHLFCTFLPIRMLTSLLGAAQHHCGPAASCQTKCLSAGSGFVGLIVWLRAHHWNTVWLSPLRESLLCLFVCFLSSDNFVPELGLGSMLSAF